LNHKYKYVDDSYRGNLPNVSANLKRGPQLVVFDC